MAEISTVVKILSTLGFPVNVATEETLAKLAPLSGASVNAAITLTLANTWYAVPSSIPTSAYFFAASGKSTNTGELYWAMTNTGTPSSVGVVKGGAEGRLSAGQVMYVASSVAGDIINVTTKEI